MLARSLKIKTVISPRGGPPPSKSSKKVHFWRKFTFPFKCFYDFWDACEMFWKLPRTIWDDIFRLEVKAKIFEFFEIFQKIWILQLFELFPRKLHIPPWDNGSNHMNMSTFPVCKNSIESSSKLKFHLSLLDFTDN